MKIFDESDRCPMCHEQPDESDPNCLECGDRVWKDATECLCDYCHKLLEDCTCMKMKLPKKINLRSIETESLEIANKINNVIDYLGDRQSARLDRIIENIGTQVGMRSSAKIVQLKSFNRLNIEHIIYKEFTQGIKDIFED